MSRRTVVFGEAFLTAARAAYPLERNLEYSGPTFGEFMARPVRAARFAFSHGWEQLHAEAGGSVRAVIIPPSGPFEPMVFYGVLVVRSGDEAVEIAGFEGDPGYWDRIDDDPED